MSSDDKKTLKMTEAKNEKKKSGNKKSIGWFFGVIVLILISITFVLPVTLFAGNTASDIVFGAWNGKDIDLNDEYFRQQVNMVAAQYQGDPNSLQGSYEIWNDAFLGTAINRALAEMAKDAKIETTHDWLDRAVIKSGFYNGEDGLFSEEKYKNTEKLEKDAIRDLVEKRVATDMVVADIAGGKTSKAELEFVKEIGSKARSFEYVVFDALAYPDSMSARYGREHEELFNSRVFSSIIVKDEETASKVLADIESGDLTFEEAAKTFSLDNFKEAGGKRPAMFRFGIDLEMKTPEDAEALFALANGEMMGPVENNFGWGIYRAEEDLIPADFTAELTLDAVKSYLGEHEQERVAAWLNDANETFIARVEADENFYDVAYDMGLEVHDVTPTCANPKNYMLFSAFQATDKSGYLAYAAQDPELYDKLYSIPDYDVVTTALEGAKLVVKANEWTDSSSSVGFIDNAYSVAETQFMLADLQNAILDSSKLENNFSSVFFEKMVASN